MGEGTAIYAGRNLLEGTHDIKDYNMYCHYVAGLVGEGLSKLFTGSGYESSQV
jgi:farnesyl-diphosphate farnesyltransferase